MFNGSRPLPGFAAVLDARTGRNLFPGGETPPEAGSNVLCAHFSPDDRWLAVARPDHGIRVFDLGSGRPRRVLSGHRDEVRFLSFSADGNLLASASLDRTVRLWRLPSGEPAGPPLEHRWPVVRVLLADDGQHLITASFASPGASSAGETGASEVQVWDVLTGRRLGDPIPTGGWVAVFVAPAPQGRFFVQDGIRDGLQVFNLGSPTEALARLDVRALHSWDFSQDGTRLALGDGESTAHVLDARTGAPLTERFRHGHWGVLAVQFDPDARQLLTASNDGSARLWDLRQTPTESTRHTLSAPIQASYTKVLSPQLGGTPIQLEDGTVRIIGDRLHELYRFTPSEPGAAIDFLNSGRHSNIWSCRYGVGTYGPTTILLWRQEGEAVRQFTLQHPDRIHAQYFSFDDRYVLSYCIDRRVRFWRTSDGTLERTVEVPKSGDGDLIALSPDGRTALWRQPAPPGAPHMHSVQFLDLETGKSIGRVHELPATIMGSPFSPDGQQMALMDALGPVTVLEARTGRVISSTITHSSNLICVEWDPAGRRLLTAGHNEEVLVWDGQTGAQLLGPLRTPGAIVRIAHWSPDGRFIVTRNEDKKVRVWDAATGEAVTPSLKHSGDVAFAFMTRSNLLITASQPDLLRAWDLKETTLPPAVLADFAKLLSGRRLSSAGAMLALKPDELAQLSRSLRTIAPQLLATP